MVLACAVIVAALGTGGLALLSLQRRATATSDDARRAAQGATAALEVALQAFGTGTSDRTLIADGTALPALGDPRIVIEYDATDPVDGKVPDDPNDAIDLTIWATSGPARAGLAARLAPARTPLDAANYAIIAGGKAILTDSLVRAPQGLHAGVSVEADKSRIDAPVTSPGAISGAEYLSTVGVGPSVRMPGGAHVAALATRGTRIMIGSIPSGAIERVVLSPSRNPYGVALDPDGIYVIACDGADLILRNVRIVGTLVVLSPGPGSRIEGSVSITPTSPELPALVWDGTLDVNTIGEDLSENQHSTNFNPPGGPFLGAVDGDTADFYPSMIAGSVVVLGDVEVRGTLFMRGTLALSGSLAMDKAMLSVEPPTNAAVVEGFTEVGGFGVVPGTVRRILE
jgi:hypothetical protein